MSDPDVELKATPATPTPKTPPAPKRRRMDTDASFARRLERRKKPFRELSLREMIDEIHDPDVDGDSFTDDDAWDNPDTRVKYLLVKIIDTLAQEGII